MFYSPRFSSTICKEGVVCEYDKSYDLGKFDGDNLIELFHQYIEALLFVRENMSYKNLVELIYKWAIWITIIS